MYRFNVEDIRQEFVRLFDQRKIVGDRTGSDVIEIVGASFKADQEFILGEPNDDYIRREQEWYYTQSRSIHKFPGKVPELWKRVASPQGMINSNYGWMVFHPDNGEQYLNVLRELQANRNSRRAVAIYARPSMWRDWNKDGMTDFGCTNAVQYLIRDGELQTVVQMRSNDAWSGYRNDFHWQRHIQQKLASELGINSGPIYWNVGSLHFYRKDWYLVDHYMQTGETSITKKRYRESYPESNLAPAPVAA